MNSTKLQDKKKSSFNWRNYTAAFGLIIVVILSVILSKTFLKPTNLMNVLKANSPTGMLALGMTFVLLTGGIDLAVASNAALCSVLIALTYNSVGIIPSIILTLIVGIMLGTWSGFCVTKLRTPPFIATLALQNIMRGLALVLTGATAIPISSKAFNNFASGKLPAVVCYGIFAILLVLSVIGFIRNRNKKKAIGSLLGTILVLAFGVWLCGATGGLNLLIVVFIIVFFICKFIIEKTVFGCQLYALGGNAEAARLSGVRVHKNLLIIYATSGFLAAISGVLSASRLGSGIPQLGLAGETDAIASVVLGGTSMSGGRGKISGTILGILLIGVLNNLLTLLGVTSDMQMIFKGAIVLIAVILDTSTSK